MKMEAQEIELKFTHLGFLFKELVQAEYFKNSDYREFGNFN